MHAPSAIRNVATLIVIGALLYGCGGSDVGKQDGVGPQAVVTVLSQPYTPASGSTPAAVTLRSQSEVTLSAKDSIDGSAPITEFTFKQTDSNPVIPLVIRTRNTALFDVPVVAQDTTYKFTLTVKDSNGRTSTADTNVLVKPVLDPNQFLKYLNTPSTYTIEAVSSADLAADSAAAVDATAGTFAITVQRFLTYRDRGGALHSDVPLDVTPNPAPIKIEGAWLQRAGASATCNAPLSPNPRFTVDIPQLKADDLNVLVQGGDRTNQLELSDIDEASLSLKISIASTAGTVVPGVCVLGQGQPTPVIQAVKPGFFKSILSLAKVSSVPTGTVKVSQLLGDPSVTSPAFDSAASALAYYKALGEENTKTTFFAWLTANGFDPKATNYGADAHAVYTNNFDLGFGRDMYMKVRNCDTAQMNLGTCDVGAVVLNYPSMEAAAKKTGPINAVAMEYSKTNGRRIVKFYAYAPDPRDANGDFRRIHSVNLDGRGEKSVPGSCTVCHGGTPRGLDASGNYVNADLDSGFLLWDLDTLLFSDTDRSFSQAPEDATLRSQLTRPAQEAEFRKLNAGSYLTYADPARFGLAKQLVAGWYTVKPLPVATLDQVLSGTHFGAFVPDEWKPAGVDIYSKVFASHCRTCHIVQAPPPGGVPDTLCDADPSNDPATRPATPHQLAFRCYNQFITEPKLSLRLSNGEMPLARLTMDRFWVSSTSAPSAGKLLVDHLAALTPPVTVTTPGVPAAAFTTQVPNDATHPDTDVDSTVLLALDRDKSRFVNTLQWKVTSCDGAGAACVPVAVVGDKSANASWTITKTGIYNIDLTATSATGAVATATSQTITVLPQDPVIDATQLPAQLKLGSAISVTPAVALGNGSSASHSFWITSLSKLRFQAGTHACDSQANACTLSEAVKLESTTLTPSVTGDASTFGAYTVVVVDADGPSVSATKSVELTTGLTPVLTAIVTNANTAVPINFGEGVTLDTGESLEVSITSGPSATNLLSQVATLLPASPATTVIRTYTPPPRYATHSKSSNTVTPETGKTLEQIGFTLFRKNSGGTVVEQRSFTRAVRIKATTIFSTDVVDGVLRKTPPYPSGNATCTTGCHAVGGTVATVPYDNDTTVYSIVFARVNSSGDPALSVMLCHPAQECGVPLSGNSLTHAGGDRGNSTSNPTGNDLAPIRKWIDEGANNF